MCPLRWQPFGLSILAVTLFMLRLVFLITQNGQRLSPRLYKPSTSLVDWSSVMRHHGSSRLRSAESIATHHCAWRWCRIAMSHHTSSCMMAIKTLCAFRILFQGNSTPGIYTESVQMSVRSSKSFIIIKCRATCQFYLAAFPRHLPNSVVQDCGSDKLF